MTKEQAIYQAKELFRQTKTQHTAIKTKRFNLKMFMAGKSEKKSYDTEWTVTIKQGSVWTAKNIAGTIKKVGVLL